MLSGRKLWIMKIRHAWGGDVQQTPRFSSSFMNQTANSSVIRFEYDLTPMLFAVLYTQAMVVLFEDVKRTGPFARLFKTPIGGASAYGTILYTPRAW